MGAQWGHAAHGPDGPMRPMGYWGAGPLAELQVLSGFAPRNRYFEELKVLCREFRNSLTSEKGVIKNTGEFEVKGT